MLTARVMPNMKLVGSRMLATSTKLFNAEAANAEAFDMPQEFAQDGPLADKAEWDNTAQHKKCTMPKDKYMDRLIRVDHAGEVGADRVYAGQHLILQNSPVSHIIREMWKQEVEHLGTWERYAKEHNARKSLLLPFWSVFAYSIGAVGALISRESAMAVTVGIEDVIGVHYNDQIRDLLDVDPNERELLKTLKQFRDDELHHFNTGLEFNAEKAVAYRFTRKVVSAGTAAAVWIAERI